MIFYFIRWWFNCSLPYDAKIGMNFEIGHGGLGCVVHADAKIGDNCHLGTQVTIGGNATEFGAPTLGNDVYVGTGAKILGPVTIGDHVVVGANSVVLKDVESGCVVGGIPAKVLQTDINVNEFIYHKRNQD